MLYLKIRSKNKEKLYEVHTNIHEALCGWEQYINNNVVLSDITIEDSNGETVDPFIPLIIGPDNGHDFEMFVDLPE